jgi:hypothetical protein
MVAQSRKYKNSYPAASVLGLNFINIQLISVALDNSRPLTHNSALTLNRVI